MTVGDAEQLVATVGVQDKVPYLFRSSGGSADIGDREVDTVVGGTVAWNQLVNTDSETVTVASGHKYFASLSGVKSIGVSDGTPISVTGGTDNVIDLTLAFGSAIADYISTLETATPGAGVAWFRALFPKPYYAYDAGELMSVQAASHSTTGFNQWDEETESGYLDLNDGTEKALNTLIRMKNYVQILPNTVYYLKCGSVATNVFRICWYDADKKYISNSSAANKTNNTTTTPANAYFMRAYFANYGTTYKNDICINLHWDGERDGEYEPYVKHVYPLDSSLILRGMPKLDGNNKLYYDGDTYESDGTVTRKYGELSNQTGAIGDTITLTGAKSDLTEIICSEGRLADIGTISGVTLTLTKAISGASIVYELEESTTETAAPYQNPQIVDDFGTEQYVDAGNRDVEIPVGHDTFYRQNLRAKLEMAPGSPDSNGDYLVRHNNGQNSYVAYASPLPAMPAEDGAYTLKGTVSDGTAELSWEADEA